MLWLGVALLASLVAREVWMIVLLFRAARSAAERQGRLAREGVRAEAYISRSRPATRLDKDSPWEVWAQFQTEEGQEIQAQLLASGRRQEDVAPGNTATVVYLPGLPQSCTLEGDEGIVQTMAEHLRRHAVWRAGRDVVLLLALGAVVLAGRARAG